ncbi:hypothetical protein BC629DRAFT_295637 [Irpex lacteus]|nr:hypothetical protein BC629DRAFT_295637 [Irpex lacteus]
MPANAAVIPDDILYHIMQVDHTMTCNDDRAAFDFWLACSSVSWQWRNVAITFLFRCITFLKSSEASNVCRMGQLSEAPHIARCIRKVLFRDTIVPIASLDRFLTHLPHLRRLEMQLVKFPESDELTFQSPSGGHQIDEVCCDSFWKADRLRYDQVVRFLQLFSKIKSLVVEDVGAVDFSYKDGLSGSDEDDDSEDEEIYDELALKQVPAAVATHRLGSLQIEELSLTHGWRNKSFISSFLCQTSSLSYLTSLVIVVEDPSEDLDRLNEILCAAGRTLKEARVDIVMCYDWFETNDLTGSDSGGQGHQASNRIFQLYCA